ncbi:MAG: hypothetical protein LBU34_15130, partial [Planctomycetaceae bacterium]|nr:hypothetical protein [Planctomycetaceae bacterium]
DRLWSLIHSDIPDNDVQIQQYTLLLSQLTEPESNIWKVLADYCVLLENLCFIVIEGNANSMKGFAKCLNEDLAVWPSDPLHHEKNKNGVYVIPPPDIPPQIIYGVSIEYPLWNTTGLGHGQWKNTCFLSAKTLISDILTIPNINQFFSEGIIKRTREDFLYQIKIVIEALKFTFFIGFPIFKGESDYFVVFFSQDDYNFVNTLSNNMERKYVKHIFFFYNKGWHQKYIGKLNL